MLDTRIGFETFEHGLNLFGSALDEGGDGDIAGVADHLAQRHRGALQHFACQGDRVDGVGGIGALHHQVYRGGGRSAQDACDIAAPLAAHVDGVDANYLVAGTDTGPVGGAPLDGRGDIGRSFIFAQVCSDAAILARGDGLQLILMI